MRSPRKLRSNKSVDTDTLRQGAASRAGERTSRGALPQPAGHLQRYAALAAVGLALAAGTCIAGQSDWQPYDDSVRGQVSEIDRNSVRIEGGKVFFSYRQRSLSGQGVPIFELPIRAVADCSTRQRADVSGSDSFTLREVFPGTGQAAQVAVACRLAGKFADVPVVQQQANADALVEGGSGSKGQPLSMEDVQTKSDAEVESRLPESHPAAFYSYAMRQFKAGRKDEAVMWFYAGQLRFRYYLKAHPSLSADGDPALMASLNATVGQVINEWAGGSPRGWAASIHKALDWDQRSPNLFTPKEQDPADLHDLRSGLAGLAKHVSASEDMIRAQRKARGLENR